MGMGTDVRISFHGEVLKNLKNALTVDLGTKSTYLHAHIPKINSSYIKIWEVGRKLVDREVL